MNHKVIFSVLSDAEMPTLRELIDELFALDLDSYDNLGFTSTTFSGLRGIIIALFIGAIIGGMASLFNKRVLGEFVRAVTAEGCNSPESAKTLAELGFLKNSAVRSSLRSDRVLGRVVRCVEEDRYEAEMFERRVIWELRSAEDGGEVKPFRAIPYKRDMNTAHFYIPADKCGEAETRFGKKGTNPAVLIIGIIAMVLLLWAVMRLLPDLFQMLDNFVGIMG